MYKIYASVILIFCFKFSFSQHLVETKGSPNTPYFFNKPATSWNEAIPIGNGRLGGMVFGAPDVELIETNEDTFWSGEPRNLQKPGTYRYLPDIRKKIFDGNYLEAQDSINKYMLGKWNESYMPLANIVLRMDSAYFTNYSRSLDISTGIVTIKYQQSGVSYKRKIFASYPDQAIIIRLTADRKGAINLTSDLTSLVRYQTAVQKNQLVIKGQAPVHIEPNYAGKHDPVYKDGHGMRFEGRLMIRETDGRVYKDGNKLKLKGASYATLVFVAATSYNGFDKNPFINGKNEDALCQVYLKHLNNKSFNKLYNTHVRDFSSLFNRVKIYLGKSDKANMPIDARISSYKATTDAPSLTALYFQFGRYLLISSSRPGSQPANLQGIWNNALQPGWSANWTLNCNAEINYWPVEMVNLPECHLPFFDLIKDASVDGHKTAKNLYNADGWIAHHNLDIWRSTWPVGGEGLWAIYQVGSAWLCQGVWDHYLYTQDKLFLKNNLKLLEGASLFYLDVLQKDKNNKLVTNPSTSFENKFLLPNGQKAWACMGAAQDMQIIRSLFENTIQGLSLLNANSNLKRRLIEACKNLAPMKISPATGHLQEWNEDFRAAEPHNGQIAQGWGLIEGDLIDIYRTPAIAAALRKTVEYRKPGYSQNSGSWVGAFASNYWAKLGEGDSVQRVIDRHFKMALYPNLTSTFSGFWQIDGNLGITAAIANMFVQSTTDEIRILPALPAKYPTGFVTGLKAKGGYTIDVKWADMTLIAANIKAIKAGMIKIRYGEHIKAVYMKPYSKLVITPSFFKE